jgi:hypothetical protein
LCSAEQLPDPVGGVLGVGDDHLDIQRADHPAVPLERDASDEDPLDRS